MSEIEIKVPAVASGGYKITIGTAILSSLWERIEKSFPKHNKFVVTDSNLVTAGHLKTLLQGAEVGTFVIDPPGETSKTIETLISIVETMEKSFLGRDTVIIALGGGTVGDIAGFAAAIYKRGIPVIQIPTTTLSQADSAVGGKTGVDSTVSKNAFGAFWQPAAVYIDVATLATLDERQFKAGLVESVKQAIIADSEYFDFLEANMDAICRRDTGVLEKIAEYNCRIKGAVVEADPTEQNQRRMLNYGHTIGHAVESVSGFELLHGEAIAIGMIAAGLIETELGLSQAGRLDRIRKILEKLNVPVSLPKNLDKKLLIEAIRRDKKSINMWPKFILIDIMGSVHCQGGQWGTDVRQDLVVKVLDRL